MTVHAPIQANRQARLRTPLGDDILAFTRLTGREALSELFEFRVEAIAVGEMPVLDDLVGHEAAVEIDVHEGKRHFHGICTQIRWLGSSGETHRFELTLRPRQWLLTLRSDSRIFKNKSVVDIIFEVLGEVPSGEHTSELADVPGPIHYCVQYQETNFDFISRLMEKHGLFYFFRHTEDGHQMVITDSNYACREIEGYEEIPYAPNRSARALRDHFRTLQQIGQVRADEVVVNSYNYETASGKLDVSEGDVARHGNTGNAIYDFRAAHGDRTGGGNIARVMLEAERARAVVLRATGNVAGLTAGAKFTIENSPLPDPEAAWLCRAVEHVITADEFRTGGGDPEEFYSGSYDLVPWERPWRAPIVTPWPQISGTHTAVVVGQKGEEIDVDEQGRIVVRFHWDRNGSWSCRVRVAQSLAGGSYGATNIPRIGHEVLITFVDGDPDRPVVIGSVYNSLNPPPIEMPANKTQMGYKSNSSKGGGGANEWLFEDKKGHERFDLTAERDFNLVVKNDANIHVGYKKQDHGSLVFDVYQDRVDTVSEGDFITWVAKGNHKRFVKKKDEILVDGDREEKVKENLLNQAKTIKITAEDEIVISVGPSSIVLNKGGVNIVGPLIKLN